MTDSPESLVFGLDVGTTQSGAAVTYIAPDTFTFSERPVSRPPTVLEKLPGQTPGRAKIPSTLLYDREGNCLKKWGFQVDSLSRDEQNLIKQGDWLKVDWFKLHIDPQNSAATRKIVEKDSRQLPKNKTGHEVWGDFLLKLSSAAKQAAQEELGITLIDELFRS